MPKQRLVSRREETRGPNSDKAAAVDTHISPADSTLERWKCRKRAMEEDTIPTKGEIQKGLLTIQQWGTPFKISAIELIEPGDEPNN